MGSVGLVSRVNTLKDVSKFRTGSEKRNMHFDDPYAVRSCNKD